MYAAHEDRLQLSSTIPGATHTNHGLVKLLYKHLSRRAKNVIPEVHDEIKAVCANITYNDGDWHIICLSDEVLRFLTATRAEC